MNSSPVTDERDAGYAEAEEMLRALLTPDLISGTAIRVARDYMMQFARRSKVSRPLALHERELIVRAARVAIDTIDDMRAFGESNLNGARDRVSTAIRNLGGPDA